MVKNLGLFRLEHFLTMRCRGCDCETVVGPCWTTQVVKKTSLSGKYLTDVRRPQSKQHTMIWRKTTWPAPVSARRGALLLSEEPGFAFLLEKKR